MILSDLKIQHLRTIRSAHLELHHRFNFISGENGSGKTSILEALYLLSCGHSFRSREIAPIINFEQQSLTVFASSSDHEQISIQKSSLSATQIKLNNQFCATTSALAYALPCQIVYADIFQILDAGPSVRRSILDWGLFHVKPVYLSLLKEYKRVLKQRNALLKKRVPYQQFVPWDLQLVKLAEQIDELRCDYFSTWQNVFAQVLSQLTKTVCTIDYYKGWDKRQIGKPLLEVLEEQFASDVQRQFTQYGIHQADVYISTADEKAKHVLSRGQQKIILIALKLAQGKLLNKHCLYLFDDLPAELDDTHLRNLLVYLSQEPGQFVITSVNELALMDALLGEVNQFTMHNGIIRKKQPFVSRETVS